MQIDTAAVQGLTPSQFLARHRANLARIMDASRYDIDAAMGAISEWAKTRQAQPAAAPDAADVAIENVAPVNPPTNTRKVGRFVLPNFGYLTRSAYKPVDPAEAKRQVNTIIRELDRLGVKVEARKVTASAAAVRVLCLVAKSGNKTKAADVYSKADDVALSLGVPAVRIAPALDMPDTVAIEYPRKDRQAVTLGDIVTHAAGDGLLVPAGFSTDGLPLVFDLARQPHILVSGTTGSGKTTFTTSLLMSVLMNRTPDAVKLCLIDLKGELLQFDGIPHLVGPIATDVAAADSALDWVLSEVARRQNLIKATKTRDMAGYNIDNPRPMPYLVVVVDECAQLIEANRDKTLAQLGTLARIARAAGVHLVIGMQRPDADIIKGEIKGNIPARVVFKLPSATDSNVALNRAGAETLRGNGDGLLMLTDSAQPVRFQGAYSSPEDVKRVLAYWERYSATPAAPAVSVAAPKPDTTQPARPAPIPAPELVTIVNRPPIDVDRSTPAQQVGDFVADVVRARELLQGLEYVSASKLKGLLKCRYDRAAAVLAELVAAGLVSAAATANKGQRVTLS